MNNPARADMSLEEVFLCEVTTLARQAVDRYLVFDAAEDVAQDIVLDCLVGLREGRWSLSTTELPRMVRTMVVRRQRNAWRTNERRARRDADYEREINAGTRVWMIPDLVVDARELEDFYERTLASLPPMCRRVYVKVREEKSTYQAAANALGISRASVHWHVATAQRRFRTALLEQGIASPPRTFSGMSRKGSPAMNRAQLRSAGSEARGESAA